MKTAGDAFTARGIVVSILIYTRCISQPLMSETPRYFS